MFNFSFSVVCLSSLLHYLLAHMSLFDRLWWLSQPWFFNAALLDFNSVFLSGRVVLLLLHVHCQVLAFDH